TRTPRSPQRGVWRRQLKAHLRRGRLLKELSRRCVVRRLGPARTLGQNALGHPLFTAAYHPPMLIYLHGFNSSPQSTKARQLQVRLRAMGRVADYRCPALPDRPAQAIALLEREMTQAPAASITLVGSSLGGYYATWLAETHGVRAVLVNPAV